jgi:T5SS/PEP-CTERM-associated repeat protein
VLTFFCVQSTPIKTPKKARPKGRYLLVICSAITGFAVVMAPQRVMAQGTVRTWVGGENYFDVASAWSPSGAPGPTDIAVFQGLDPEFSVPTHRVNWDNTTGNRTIQRLRVLGGNSLFVNLEVGSSSPFELTLNATDSTLSNPALLVEGSGTSARIRGLHFKAAGFGQVDNATLTIDGGHPSGAQLSLGALFLNGTLNIEAGGVVDSQATVVGFANEGTIRVTGVGSRLSNSEGLGIGLGQSGTLAVEDGGEVFSATGSVGAPGGGTGLATVTGAGSKWTNSGELSIARGNLTVDAGGQVSSNGGTIGEGNGATAAVLVRGSGSKWTNSGALGLGTDQYQNTLDEPTATLNVQDGAEVSNTSAVIGINRNAMVTVENAGSKWTNSGALTLGDNRTGTLNVQAGGQVSSTLGVLGNSAGSTGTATVTGLGSRWTNSGNLTIGGLGTGSLSVLAGGETSNVSGLIGNFAGSTGTVTVSGAGSRWTNTGSILIGGLSTGTLMINEAGQVSSNFGFIGAQVGSTGTATVNGTNSKWTNSGDLSVGFEGAGTLNVNNGGLVSVGGTTSINAVSQVNLNGGRFEFGTTDQTSFKRINAVSGSLAGTLNVSGLNAASSFTALTNGADSSGVIVVNSGRLFGDGLLGASVVNLSNGEIRVSSNQFMAFEGVGNINAGEINNTGGRIEFNQGLQNDAGGFISGRGEFAANAGWTNNGVMAFSGGLADVYGDIANSVAGRIAIAGNSTTTFYDDVTMSAGNMNVNISQNGNAVFFGSYNGGSTGGGNVYTFGDLRPGNSPGVITFGGDLIMGSDTLTQFELGGLSTGMFDQLLVSGNLFLNGNLDIKLIDGFTLGYNQTYDVGLVNGDLFGKFSNFNDGDRVGNFGGVDLFIDYRSGDASGNGVSLITAVPEPSSMLLVAAIGMGAMGFRLRKRSLREPQRREGTKAPKY